MTAPVRIQRSRAKGWKMPPNTIYVGRGSKFGNLSACTRPHNCLKSPCTCCPHDGDRYCCVDTYREFVMSGIEKRAPILWTFNVAQDAAEGYPYRTRLVAALYELRGKNLACWCPLVDERGVPVPCHADVLLEVAAIRRELELGPRPPDPAP